MTPRDVDDPYDAPPSPWRIVGLVVLGIAMGLLVLSLLPGCAAQRFDAAADAANGAREVGAAAADTLHDACTVRYDAAVLLGDPAKRRDEVAQLDRVCVPLATAYDAYEASHAALVAGIQAGLGEVELLVLVRDLSAAGQRLSRALSAVGGALR